MLCLHALKNTACRANLYCCSSCNRAGLMIYLSVDTACPTDRESTPATRPVLMTEGCTRLQGASSIRGFEQKTHRFMFKWMDQAWTKPSPKPGTSHGLFGWCQSFLSNLMVCSHVLCHFSSAVEIKRRWKHEWGVNKWLVPL